MSEAAESGSSSPVDLPAEADGKNTSGPPCAAGNLGSRVRCELPRGHSGRHAWRRWAGQPLVFFDVQVHAEDIHAAALRMEARAVEYAADTEAGPS